MLEARSIVSAAIWALMGILAVSCSEPAPAADGGPRADASTPDASRPDASLDAGRDAGGERDAGAEDAGAVDAAVLDASAPDAAGPDASTPCNEIVNDAPEVEGTLVSEPAPAPLGGEIASGRYHLTSIVFHVSAAAAFRGREIWEIDGSVVQQVTSMSVLDRRSTWTFETEGTLVTRTPTCGLGVTASTDGYTATADEIVLYRRAPTGSVSAWTYTRQE